MELRLRNVLMLLFPTSLLGLSYFWWWQKKIEGGEKGDDKPEVLNPSKNIEAVSEEIITEVQQEETFSCDSNPPLEDTLDDSLSLQEYHHVSVKRKREHSCCDSAFVEDFSSDNVSTTGSDSNKTSSTTESPEDPTCHDETPEALLENDVVCEEIVALEVNENVESAPSNNFRDWFTPLLENQTEQDILAPKELLENDVVCEEIIAPEVNENVESSPSNNFCDWFTPLLENQTEQDILAPKELLENDVVCEEIIAPEVNENVESSPSNNFCDRFTPLLENQTEQDNLAKIIHWGSQPVSDLENEDEVNPIKQELVGGVAIEKLNIVLEKEYNQQKANMKRSEKPKRSPKKSPRSPKKTPKSPRTPKTSESSSLKSPKNKKSPKQKERDFDKPWREESNKKQDNKSESECDPLYPNDYVVMEYTVSEDLCGKIIGRHGKAVRDINEKTGAIVCIEAEKVSNQCLLSISGLYFQVQDAEKCLMTKHKNTLKKYTSQWPKEIGVGNSSLPMEVYVDVIVTAVINAGNLFLQIFDADVDHKLMQLQNDLGEAYSQPPQRVLYHDSKKPAIGEICVAFVDNMWCRMKVLEYTAEQQVVVVFVDYGGSVILDWHLLFKIRFELFIFFFKIS